MELKFDVQGMTCSACSAAVEREVSKVDGVSSVAVNLLTNSMKLEADKSRIPAILQAVDDAGYTATPADAPEGVREAADPFEKEAEEKKRRLIFSVALLIPLLYISMGSMMGLPIPAFLAGTENLLSFALAQAILTMAILFLNRHYYKNGLKSLWKRHPNMDALIAIGSGAAFLYGIYVIFQLSYGFGHGDMERVMHFGHELYFESAATIVVLIDFGKWLESRAKHRTSDAIRGLMDLTPKTATVIRDGAEMRVPVAEIALGEKIVLKPGENVPVDGTVVEGISSVDESALSGESIPVEKSEGDALMAATTNGSGRLVFTADRVGEDTTIAKIIALVEDANATKAPISKIADRVAGVFVPVVIAIAAIVGIVWLLLGYGAEFALRLAISVLVISCPCALGLATPVAIMVGTGRGAKAGVLYKSAESLEVLHEADTLILDKTGTITRGKPFVTDVVALDRDPEAFYRMAYALEKSSEHPLAEGVIRGFEARYPNASADRVTDFESLPGRGLRGKIDGRWIYGGNITLMEEMGQDLSPIEQALDEALAAGKTPLVFADEDEVYGFIAAKDIVKANSPRALEALRKLGKKIVMLTGDNEKTAHVIAASLPIDTVHAGVLPDEKESVVRRYQEAGKVAMVGDGINDAPALARADVGIAIGAGTDIAMESADVVLMHSDLLDVVSATKLSEATIRNIKENLFWAFFYNVICIPVAAGVFYIPFGLTLSPMIAALAMSLSSVFVVTNALRLNFTKLDTDRGEREAEAAPEAKIYRLNATSHPQKGYTHKYSGSGKEKIQMDKKILELDGMSCNHCVGRVDQALNALEGVKAQVTLDPQQAVVEGENLDADALKKAVEDAGYTVKSVR